MPENQSLPGANIRSQDYYVARTDGRCRHCGSSTQLLALALPRNHETLDADDPSAWRAAGANAFIFEIEQLPNGVQRRLRRLSECFRLAHAAAMQVRTWSNHCDHCSVLLEDNDLHCEFDGAFVPSSKTAAANIQLLRIPEPFEAVAAGYAFAPEFFQFIRRS